MCLSALVLVLVDKLVDFLRLTMNAQNEELLDNYDPVPAYLVTGEVPEPEEVLALILVLVLDNQLAH